MLYGKRDQILHSIKWFKKLLDCSIYYRKRKIKIKIFFNRRDWVDTFNIPMQTFFFLPCTADRSLTLFVNEENY